MPGTDGRRPQPGGADPGPAPRRAGRTRLRPEPARHRERRDAPVTALAALAGLGVVGGALARRDRSAAACRVDRPARRRRAVERRSTHGRAAAAATGCGLVVLVRPAGQSRLPAPGSRLVRRGHGFAALDVARTEARTEAIALWAEMLRDAIGTARGIEGVLVATAPTAPLPIRAEVQTMARRLEYEPLDAVLDDLGDDLDHPIGDLVVTALRLTATAGAARSATSSRDLATAAYAEAESHRRIDVARERPRAAMRYTAAVIARVRRAADGVLRASTWRPTAVRSARSCWPSSGSTGAPGSGGCTAWAASPRSSGSSRNPPPWIRSSRHRQVTGEHRGRGRGAGRSGRLDGVVGLVAGPRAARCGARLASARSGSMPSRRRAATSTRGSGLGPDGSGSSTTRSSACGPTCGCCAAAPTSKPP